MLTLDLYIEELQKKKPITINLTEGEIEAIEKLANKHKVKRATFLSLIVKAYIKDSEGDLS